MFVNREINALLRPKIVSGWRNSARLFRRGIRVDQGAAIVEMALVSSVLFAMLFGIFQISLALYTYDYITDAAREGSRWAIVRGSNCSINTPTMDHCNATPSDVQTYVQSLGFPFAGSVTATTTWCNAIVSSSGVTTWATPPCSGTNDPGNQVRVNVSIQLPLAIPFVRNAPISLGSTSTMVVSQ